MIYIIKRVEFKGDFAVEPICPDPDEQLDKEALDAYIQFVCDQGFCLEHSDLRCDGTFIPEIDGVTRCYLTFKSL